MKINVNLFPRNGGYMFVESDGTRIRADSWGGVFARVKDYRKRNNLPMGEVEREVRAQACQRNPTLCSNDSPEQQKIRKIASLKGRVLAWLSRMRGEVTKIEFVSADIQKQRAAICAGCAENRKLVDGCTSCKKVVAEMRREILGSQRNIDSRLYGCSAIGHDNAVASHVEDTRIEASDAPAHCWRKIGGGGQ